MRLNLLTPIMNAAKYIYECERTFIKDTHFAEKLRTGVWCFATSSIALYSLICPGYPAPTKLFPKALTTFTIVNLTTASLFIGSNILSTKKTAAVVLSALQQIRIPQAMPPIGSDLN